MTASLVGFAPRRPFAERFQQEIGQRFDQPL
jgi:hypothetical protein